MPIPRDARPLRSSRHADVYRLPIKHAKTQIIPGVQTSVLTYDGDFIGPTIRVRSGRRALVVFDNHIDEHTNVHLHGGHVPAASDGHPMDVIDLGASRAYNYPNKQRGATLWYHAHAHHAEATQVNLGLHGFYLVEDRAEAHLRLPRGRYDVPIMLRDATLDQDGQLVLFGDPADRMILANGKPTPFFEVRARKYRLRFLNGSTRREYRLDLGGATMVQIAADGGLLPAPVSRSEFRFGPGERMDVIVDFSRYAPGTQLVLSDGTAGPVLRFDVTRRAQDSSRIPHALRALPTLGTATVTRDVVLSTEPSDAGPVGQVNGRAFDPSRVDFTIKHGTTEIWNIQNADVARQFPHNFHLHRVQFVVLDRSGNPPSTDDAGLKDTVNIPPGETVRIKAKFDGGHLGRYMNHCHFLEHADIGMMAQMEIVP